jgi:hypothetical protein
VPMVAGRFGLVVVVGPGVVRHGLARPDPREFGRHAQPRAGHYGFPDGLTRLQVRHDSPLLGVPPADIDISAYPGLTLLGVQAGPHPGPARHPVQAEDVLVVSGDADTIGRLAREQGLAVAMQTDRR